MLIWKHGDTEITEEVQCQIPVFFARQGTHPIEFDGARAVPALHRIGIRKSGWAGLLSLHGWPRKILSGRRRRERLRPDVLTTLGGEVIQPASDKRGATSGRCGFLNKDWTRCHRSCPSHVPLRPNQ